MSLGLALSGGGAKGVAHIGVIEALRDNNINIDYISGASSGSVIASLYAAGYLPNEILKAIVQNSKNNSLLDYDKKAPFKLMKYMLYKKVNLSGFIKGNKIEYLLREYLRSKNVVDINDCKIKIAIPIVNVRTGEVVYYTNSNAKKNKTTYEINEENKDEKYLNIQKYDDIPEYRNEGDVADIVRASISFPGVFMPKKIGKELYIDGGVRVNTPVNVLKKMGANKVIAISFDRNKMNKNNLKNIIGITSQAFDILTHEASEKEQKYADINVRICEKNVSLLDFSKSVHLAQKGYNIVNNNIDYIKEKLHI